MFLLIGAQIEWSSNKSACIRCEIAVKGERRFRNFELPVSQIKQVERGILAPDWLIEREANKYRSMFGTTMNFVADKVLSGGALQDEWDRSAR